MNTRNKSNLIVSIILALVPLGPLAFLLPAGDMIAGFVIVAALATMGVLELRGSASTKLARRQPKGATGLYRSLKSQA